ncbi:MAG: ferritin family protein [Phycisphaerae bacterium]
MSYCLEEVFEMACQIERNGAAFYEAAARKTDSQDARKVLNELAHWEHRHEEILEQMRNDLPEEDRTRYYDPDGEATMYIDALTAGKIFPASPPDNVPDTDREVLAQAVAREKDSVVFYVGLRAAVEKGSDQVDAIITEEMRHLRILSGLLEKL